MKTVDIKEARESLGEYAARGESLPIVVTDHGRPVAALLPVPDPRSRDCGIEQRSQAPCAYRSSVRLKQNWLARKT